MGKPQNAVTFGDLAKVFVQSVYQSGSKYSRIDVVFDRFDHVSIKSGTRTRRRRGAHIRRKIELMDVPLPQYWNGFLSHQDNKADLARLLSDELISNSSPVKTIIVAGGFTEATNVASNNPNIDITQLECCHEEADTRIVLHCAKASSDTIVVSARDACVFLLLIAHFGTMGCTHLWLKAGTHKKPKIVPVREVIDANYLEYAAAQLLLPFHALTGYDTTSYMSGHSKKTALKVIVQHRELLQGLGREPLTEETMTNAESFICNNYNVPEVTTTDKARLILFKKALRQELLPPTRDAVRHHIQRAHYQSFIWLEATTLIPKLPPATTMGWQLTDDELKPVLSSLPAVPASCLQLITCGCTTRCSSQMCKCRKSRLPCTGACKCAADCMNADVDE